MKTFTPILCIALFAFQVNSALFGSGQEGVDLLEDDAAANRVREAPLMSLEETLKIEGEDGLNNYNYLKMNHPELFMQNEFDIRADDDLAGRSKRSSKKSSGKSSSKSSGKSSGYSSKSSGKSSGKKGK